MKKIYNAPRIEIVKNQMGSMIAASLSVGDDTTNEQYARPFSYFDADDLANDEE